MVPVIIPSGLAGAVLLLLVRSGEQARFGSAGGSGEGKQTRGGNYHDDDI